MVFNFEIENTIFRLYFYSSKLSKITKNIRPILIHIKLGSLANWIFGQKVYLYVTDCLTMGMIANDRGTLIMIFKCRIMFINPLCRNKIV